MPFSAILLGWWAVHALVTWIILLPIRREPAMHWTERARLAFPIGVLESGRFYEAVPVALMAVGGEPTDRPFEYVLAFCLFLTVRLLITRALFLTSGIMEDRPADSFFRIWAFQMNPLITPGTGLALLAGLLWEQKLGPFAWGCLGIAAFLLIMAHPIIRHSLFRSQIHHLREDELLKQRLDRLVPIPFPVAILDSRIANGYATQFPRRILLTSEMLRILEPAQVDAIFLHEYAHLTEPLRPVIFRQAIYFAQCLVVLLFPALYEFGPIAVCAALYSWIWIVRKFLSSSLEMEYRADAQGMSQDSREYALGLERMYRHNLSPAYTGLSGSHPDLWYRMKAAGVEPSWPRPLPVTDPRIIRGIQLIFVLSMALTWHLLRR